MKANLDKCHLLLITQEEANIKINNTIIECKKVKKVLGIILDTKFKFDKHTENIYQKANRKLNALARLINNMELPKRRILMHAPFKAQFNYCPIVCMFPTRSLNKKINRLHKRYLRIIYISIQIINIQMIQTLN